MNAPASDFRNYLLAEFKCAALRASILQADVEAIATALRGNLITPNQALKLLDDYDALRLVGTPPSKSEATDE